MLSFECDYNNGAHPKVLQHLIDTNAQQSLTYGFDEWTESAKRKIRQVCQAPDADIFFLAGGTQANATVIDSMLATCEAVIAADTAHINVHEAGAVEASGHRVLALPSHEGKILPADLARFMQQFDEDESRDHLAQPGMVYITLPTEYGTIYKAEEISAIQAVCRKHQLKLFVDGARLGYALMADTVDISLPWLARHCDAFYIGGTKVGALCGEAVVFPFGNAPRHFFSNVKRHGALLAKGRLTGVQFDALFTDNLYFDISRHAIRMANKLKRVLQEAGLEFYLDSPTNQQFVVMPTEQAHKLKQQVDFTLWGPAGDDKMVCRFVTSWATTQRDIEQLRKILVNCQL